MFRDAVPILSPQNISGNPKISLLNKPTTGILEVKRRGADRFEIVSRSHTSPN
ncbi:hypothetical protein NCCP2648_13960 [Lacticaseibacillus rhamnosus]|jgi:hypothetical protein|nr:hypothetical protein NCCP2648_13960 [Lacticaseibacillus rhamnosus]